VNPSIAHPKKSESIGFDVEVEGGRTMGRVIA